jgi:hypothetical protein
MRIFYTVVVAAVLTAASAGVANASPATSTAPVVNTASVTCRGGLLGAVLGHDCIGRRRADAYSSDVVFVPASSAAAPCGSCGAPAAARRVPVRVVQGSPCPTGANTVYRGRVRRFLTR